MKDKIDPRMDPVLEECYRMKEEFAAQFNSAQELYGYLKAEQKKSKHSVGNISLHRSPEPSIIRRIDLFTRNPLEFTEFLFL